MPSFDDPLDALSPEDFERELSTLPACDLPELPTTRWTTVAIPEIGLAIPLPPGHVVEDLKDDQVPNSHDWAAKLDPDTTLIIQYIEGIVGQPNYFMQIEGGEQLSEIRCSLHVAGHPAEVRLLGYRISGVQAYCAAISAVIRRGTYLGAGIMTSTEVGRVAALTALARSRFFPLA
jgi:hypothetical protein